MVFLKFSATPIPGTLRGSQHRVATMLGVLAVLSVLTTVGCGTTATADHATGATSAAPPSTTTPYERACSLLTPALVAQVARNPKKDTGRTPGAGSCLYNVGNGNSHVSLEVLLPEMTHQPVQESVKQLALSVATHDGDVPPNLDTAPGVSALHLGQGGYLVVTPQNEANDGNSFIWAQDGTVYALSVGYGNGTVDTASSLAQKISIAATNAKVSLVPETPR